jgi:hypothetical protein
VQREDGGEVAGLAISSQRVDGCGSMVAERGSMIAGRWSCSV